MPNRNRDRKSGPLQAPKPYVETSKKTDSESGAFIANGYDPKETWKTSDFYLASFLIAKGINIVGLDDERPRRNFIFHDAEPEKREQLTSNFRLGLNDEVKATELFAAQRRLRNLLRGDN